MNHRDDLIAKADRARLAAQLARVKNVPLPTLIDPLTGQPWSEALINARGTPVALPKDRFADMEERLHAASTLLAAAVHQLNGLSQVLSSPAAR